MIRPTRPHVVAVTLAVVAATVLAGCTDDTPTPRRGATYVAMGDSAVAGAGIGDGEAPCYRSASNYPSLIARSLDLSGEDFVDVSCPGATTRDVLDGRRRPPLLDPQVDALGQDTQLVTISIGGNDAGYIPSLFAYCYLPPTRSAAACEKTIKALPALVPGIQRAVQDALTTITERAPRARVVLVSYLRLMPDDGTCQATTVPGTESELSAGAAAEGQLADAMRTAADDAGVMYVSMREASATHSACAGDRAWTSGVTAKAGDGSALHPNAAGMKAVAERLLPAVKPG